MYSNTFRWIISQLFSKKRLYFATMFLVLVYSFLNLSLPVVTGIIFDVIENSLVKQTSGIDDLLFYCTLLAFLTVAAYVLSVISWYIAELYAAKVVYNIRQTVFKALQKQSHSFYDNKSTGDLLSASTTDIMQLWDFFWIFPYLGWSGFSSLFIMIFLMVMIDTWLGILTILFCPIILIIAYYFAKKFNPQVYESRKTFGQLSRVLQENIEGTAVSRVFGNKDIEYTRFNTYNVQYRDAMFAIRKEQSKFRPQMNVLTGVLMGLVLIIGSFRFMAGEITIGQLTGSILLVNMVRRPIEQLTDFFIDFGLGFAASKRVFELLSSVPDISDSENALELEGDSVSIAIHNVNFTFKEAPVLSNINLEIPANSTIAILGTSGSGKSSLINLIPRFYDPVEGEVLINNINIKNYSLDSLRNTIGFVDQETFLFSRTISENIAFGNGLSNVSEIEKVAKMAQAHDFIMSLPKKYDTLIGERGVNLSGGQRQRLSIARALLINPKIIIFDDSLSAVDTKTEKNIREAIQNLVKERTTIIVTQRLSLLSKADKIIIMNDGLIIEEGTHVELLQNHGVYHTLIETEKDGFIDLSILKSPKVVVK